MDATKLGFVFVWSLFFFAITFLSSLYGTAVLTDSNIALTIPPTPGILDILLFPLQAVSVFIQFMFVDSSFFLFGAVIIPSFLIGMLWAIAELLRGN